MNKSKVIRERIDNLYQQYKTYLVMKNSYYGNKPILFVDDSITKTVNQKLVEINNEIIILTRKYKEICDNEPV